MDKFNFLCPNHIAELQKSERNAMAYWCEMMRRGGRAYTECRVDASELYFSAAAEIYLLRLLCKSNKFFNELHLKKPVEFLLELFLQNQNYKKANSLLMRLRQFLDEEIPDFENEMTEYFGAMYRRVEQEEKQFLYERRHDSVDTGLFKVINTASTQLH